MTTSTTLMRGLAATALLATLAMGCSSDDSSDESTDAGNTATTQEATSSTKPKTKTTTTEDESSDTTVDQDTTDETIESAGNPWQVTASLYQGEIGKKVSIECTPGGEASIVWGTETYTDDSSICTAAVHAGLITFAEGGTVTIEITEGEDAYEGSEANGVTTNDYASWGGSFVFVGQAS